MRWSSTTRIVLNPVIAYRGIGNTDSRVTTRFIVALVSHDVHRECQLWMLCSAGEVTAPQIVGKIRARNRKPGVRSGCPNRERPGHIGDFFRERRAELATQTIFEITASAPDQEEVYERRRARRRELASLSLRQRLAQGTRFSQ